MYDKMPKLKALQDSRVLNYQPNRSALPKPPAFFLINIQPGLMTTEAPQRRLVIPITIKDNDSEAQPVKITHR